MKEWFEKHFADIIAGVIIIAITAGCIALGMSIVKWIVESDMPDWLKFWLIMS